MLLRRCSELFVTQYDTRRCSTNSWGIFDTISIHNEGKKSENQNKNQDPNDLLEDESAADRLCIEKEKS